MYRYLVFAALLAVALSAKSYSGHQVLRVTPRTDDELRVLTGVKKTIANMVDFWKGPRAQDAPVDIMVSADHRDLVRSLIESRGFEVETMIDDVETLANRQKERSVGSINAGFEYDVYHTLEEINAWMASFADSYPYLTSLVTVGQSYEGRDILALKVGAPKIGTKPIVWLEGGIHAREWVSPAAMIYMTRTLVEDYDTDAEVKEMVDNLDFYMLINYNPDGYQYTWTDDRMWRKTRSNNVGRVCDGVDPNRNWDYQWGGSASTAPCAQDYQGPFANSEIEVATVTDYISKLDNVKVFIDFHAYSQMWLTPWGYTTALPSDFADQYSLTADAVAALSAKYGTTYEYGTIARTIYAASGSSADWAYGQAGVKYSFAVELRDTGRYGFLLPADQIIPTAEETFEAVKVIAKAVMP